MDGLTAWHGIVVMNEAKWTDKDGSTVTFKLPMNKDAEERRNPFQRFTKRRKGLAGTRFYMSCALVVSGDEKIVYSDEVMLAGWNDSQSTGHTVKFWLATDEMGHPFEGFERTKDQFAISLVELGDDNEPVDQKVRERMEKTGKRPSERLSYVAAMMCKNEGFWTWCQENDYTLAGNPVVDEESAKLWIYLICNINSRAALDDPENKEAIKEFHDIRKGFIHWQERRNETPF